MDCAHALYAPRIVGMLPNAYRIRALSEEAP
jgi:hypothetical protein